MTKITIERETLERAQFTLLTLRNRHYSRWTGPENDAASATITALRAALRAEQPVAAQPAEVQQEPLTDSYVQQVPDKCDRITWRNHYYSLPPAPAAVPLTDEKIDHTLATTLDEFARTTRGMSHALDVNADITANSRLRRMFARAVLAAGDKP